MIQHGAAVPAATAAAVPADDERLRSLLQSAADMIAICDARGGISYASPAIVSLLGFTPTDLAGAGGEAMLHPDDVQRVRHAFAELRRCPENEQRLDARVRLADGGWRHLECSLINLLGHPSIGGVVLSARDITEHKLRAEKLQRQAVYDPLTGLPNRTLFHDRLAQACARARREDAVVGVVLLDLDRFKQINEVYGVAGADELLCGVARRLEQSLRGSDTITRLGGDEFAVILEDLNGASGSRHAAERMIDALRPPFLLGERPVTITASIGVSVAPGGQATPEELARQADVALYQAKAEGRTSFVVFDAQIDGAAMQRLTLEGELRSALERGELRVHYQPEVDLATRAVVGVEALVRWQHPRRGLICPAEFIPLAEASGLIFRLDRWVLEQACKQAVIWRSLRPGAEPLVMAVNLSARQLQHTAICDEVARVLSETGLDPASLRLEITESAVIEDADVAIATLHALKGLGVQLAIDDFGTGYSSLSYLRRFPVSTLKIDREFVMGLDADVDAATIVRAVAELGHGLGMAVTVEGIETLSQLDRARELNCDRGQGNYLWQALPGEAITGILAAGA